MMLLDDFESVVVEGKAMGECVLVVEGEGMEVLRELGIGVGWLERVGTGWTCDGCYICISSVILCSKAHSL